MEARKIVIVGLGSISKKHIIALREIDNEANIFALRSNKGAKEVEGIQSFYEIDEIGQIQPSFIMICNPTILHESTIQQLVQFRIPLFIEKPSLHRLTQAEQIIKTISQYNIKTYVACNLRFLGSLKFVHKHLTETRPRLNEVNVYAGSYLPDWRPDIDFRKNYSANSDMGGGVHLDLIHELDYLYWFFGKPYEVQRLLTQSSSLEIDAVDYANYNLRYPTFTANIILNYYRKEYKRTLELVFDEDIWLVDIAKNTIYSSVKNEFVFKSTENILNTYKPQMEYFIQSIEGEEPAFNSITESIEVLKIALNDV